MSNQYTGITLEDRIRPSIGESGKCWTWHLAKNHAGYGRFNLKGVNTPAHRVVYEVLLEKIPEGFQLDHLCHNADPTCKGGPTCLHRACVNPEHLQAVTPQENHARLTARTTHCKHGHEFTDKNAYITRDNRRQCRICGEARRAKYEARRKA